MSRVGDTGGYPYILRQLKIPVKKEKKKDPLCVKKCLLFGHPKNIIAKEKMSIRKNVQGLSMKRWSMNNVDFTARKTTLLETKILGYSREKTCSNCKYQQERRNQV